MRFIKESVKELLYRPSGVAFGERSYIQRPYSISGRKRVRIGKRTSIGGGLHIQAITEYAGVRYMPTIEIGDDVYIGGHAYFTAIDRISVGDGCVLSEYVYLTDEVHGMDPRAGLIMEQSLISRGPVVIGRSCFLGFRVAVMPGVTLGEHCVVGANSTVTRSFPAYSMIGGSPARILKRYSQTLGRWVSAKEELE
jgi:acetyltransferase-like isoleucine patch superfamily enzyme